MRHDILQEGDCSVSCSCGAVIAGSSLEDAKRRHGDHYGLSMSRERLQAAREALGEDTDGPT